MGIVMLAISEIVMMLCDRNGDEEIKILQQEIKILHIAKKRIKENPRNYKTTKWKRSYFWT